MLKLITIIAALVPIAVFLKTVFFKRSKVVQQAASTFRTQVGYLAWGILIAVSCGIAYSVGRLIYSMWTA
jgi:MFS-type transporter involved in bile tolerance (Atg22 family)